MATRYYVPMKCSPAPSHQKKKSKKETEEHGKYHRDEINKLKTMENSTGLTYYKKKGKGKRKGEIIN